MVDFSQSQQAIDAKMLIEHSIHIPSQTIMLTGDVDSEMYETLLLGLILIQDRHLKKDLDLTIELNSPGGTWYDGMAIYDRLESCTFPVTIKASGMAMSIASVILQAGDVKLITPGTTVMVHDGTEGVSDNPENVLAWAKHGQINLQKMYKIYARSGVKTAKFWEKNCKQDFILSAEKAIKLGLADGYVE